MTVEEALEHPWITEAIQGPARTTSNQSDLATQVFLRLANFGTTKLLQVEILLVFVKQILNENDLKANRDAF